ncbi:hypothetical protein BCF33_1328 [Hasllibacter halocynthiae]|uniref:VOC domain-containing protein n=1 Tax=Hasllibacter halocynthiae TaxID=595589 RepID=A0A2T0X9Y7_9RHOB|nr:VOC family protein [Hasllibacter halocynthiae]PRY95704.1 hypothetical protein BCF33_1328 [Hasllibacter halocynthiae]
MTFHLALNVDDLGAARAFYGCVLGCAEGRSAASWVDFDFFGHQISLHLGPVAETRETGRVGEHMVPMPHFGAILDAATFAAAEARLHEADTPFVIEPVTRFPGEPGEQRIMFLRDPAGNALEFKCFPDGAGVFAA